MNTGKQLVVETNLGRGGGEFFRRFTFKHTIYCISGPSAVLFPKTYDIFVISLQCLMAVIFHNIFVQVLRSCITYKRFFSVMHTPIWKLS